MRGSRCCITVAASWSPGCGGIGPLETLPGQVIGAKPAAVCRWIFTLLGAGPGDTLDDLFPGSGAVGRAWAGYTGSEPSRPAASDASRAARADASFPAAGDGLDSSDGAWDDGCLFPLEAAW
jgi:hypothetical protein